MAKLKIYFVCQNCGYKNPKWLGKCPECNQFNTLIEEIEEPQAEVSRPILSDDKPIPISEVKAVDKPRISTRIPEMDRILGGGVVIGSTLLIGGDPGIGKSTLILQVSDRVAQQGKRVLYVTAEESIMQTKLRADRLGIRSSNLFIVAETNLADISKHIETLQPSLVVIDSIQMIYRPEIPSAPGTVSQVRESATELIYVGKRRGISLFIIGHVTKDGSIAGPKTLEHLVDGVFYFEGDRFQSFRILRAVKNRFGSTNEIGIFEMHSEGLVEVQNPSELFMSQDRKNLVGSVVMPSIVGTRTLLVEVQALTSKTGIGIPARKVSGVDFNRVAMIIAVLERRGGLHLGMEDIFVNVVGGVEIDEPAADLAIASAIASNFRGKSIDSKTVVLGELGLAGEVRGVTLAAQRLQEAGRLGFTKAIIPKDNSKGLGDVKGVEVIAVSNLRVALEEVGVI